jgi:cell wall assembly regulator SMI1
MTEIRNTWTRIENWYRAHVPSEDFFLSPRAENQDIRNVEQVIGIRLPKVVKESYRIHNGSDHHAVFEYGFHLLSLEDVLKSWEMWREHVKNGVFDGMTPNPQGPIKKDWWNLKWIPITHNSGGDHHCVDMDPDKGGVKGQVIKFSHEPGPQRVVGKSLELWLLDFAERLENGKLQFDKLEHWMVPVNQEE